MGDEFFYPPCSQCGGNKITMGFCTDCYDIRVLERSTVHQKSNVYKGDKQSKRDSYNSYLKKVVK